MNPGGPNMQCGGTGAVSSSLGVVDVAFIAGGAFFTIISTIAQLGFGGPIVEAQGIAKVLGQSAVAAGNVTAWGAGSAVMVVLAAATAAFIVSWIAISNAITLAAPPTRGTFGCAAGVVETVAAADTTLFDMHHGRVDLVVKQTPYWNELAQGNPPFLWCAGCANCSSAVQSSPPSDGIDCSPILRCYYRSSDVVAAAIGTAIGATAGAIGGAILGSIAGIAAMAALGCGITAVFALICLAVVLLAVVIAVAIVVVCALVAGAIGNAAGALSAADDVSPAGQQGGISVFIGTGTYMSAFGNLIQVPDANGANALWYAGWVTNSQGAVIDITVQTSSGTTVFGQSLGSQPFCHTDPDANIPGDPCVAAKAQAAAALNALGTP